MDQDRNGLADRFEEVFKAHDPNQDDETEPGASHPGEGLTAFEEYRRVHSQGMFFRPSPTRRTCSCMTTPGSMETPQTRHHPCSPTTN